jgi:uncharacterized protein (DUF58 family)
VVCERQAAGAAKMQFVLDLDSAAHEGAGEYDTREWAIRIVGSLANLAFERLASVELIFADQALAAGRGQNHALKLGDLLAEIPPQTAVSLSELLSQPACRSFRDGLQVVVTTNRAFEKLERRLRLANAHFIVLRGSSACPSTPDCESANGLSDAMQLGPSMRPWIACDCNTELPEHFGRAWQEILCAN